MDGKIDTAEKKNRGSRKSDEKAFSQHINSVNSDELHKVVPGDSAIELKSSKKVRGDKYYAFAIFNNPQKVHDAHANVEGFQEKDKLSLHDLLRCIPEV